MKELKKKKKWSIRYAPTVENATAVKNLSEQLGVSLTTAKLLFTRGLTTADAATVFLKQAETSLHDPFLLKDIKLAVARILSARRRRCYFCQPPVLIFESPWGGYWILYSLPKPRRIWTFHLCDRYPQGERRRADHHRRHRHYRYGRGRLRCGTWHRYGHHRPPRMPSGASKGLCACQPTPSR